MTGDTLYVHQFTGATLTAPLASGQLTVDMVTGYPWSGAVQLRVTSTPPGPCGYRTGRPGPGFPATAIPWRSLPPQRGMPWCTAAGSPATSWSWSWTSAPRLTYPNRHTDALRGTVAVGERGPLVYCFEQADQGGEVEIEDLAVNPGGPWASSPRPPRWRVGGGDGARRAPAGGAAGPGI